MQELKTGAIFVSYALADRSLVKPIFDQLKTDGIVSQNEQITDHAKILVEGHSERSVVRKAIEDASRVIVILSKGSAESEWVNYETAMADALGKRIIMIVPKGDIKKGDFHFDKAAVT